MQMFGTFAVVWGVLQYLQDRGQRKKTVDATFDTLRARFLQHVPKVTHSHTPGKLERYVYVTRLSKK